MTKKLELQNGSIEEVIDSSTLATLNIILDVSLDIIDRSIEQIEELVIDEGYRVHPDTMEKIKHLYNRFANIINSEIPE